MSTECPALTFIDCKYFEALREVIEEEAFLLSTGSSEGDRQYLTWYTRRCMPEDVIRIFQRRCAEAEVLIFETVERSWSLQNGADLDGSWPYYIFDERFKRPLDKFKESHPMLKELFSDTDLAICYEFLVEHL